MPEAKSSTQERKHWRACHSLSFHWLLAFQRLLQLHKQNLSLGMAFHFRSLKSPVKFAGFGQQQQQPGFGMQQQQQGSKNVQYQKVPDTEGTGSAKTNVALCTIVAMPAFQPPNEKSFAELRWEDYQVQRPVTFQILWTGSQDITRLLQNCFNEISCPFPQHHDECWLLFGTGFAALRHHIRSLTA